MIWPPCVVDLHNDHVDGELLVEGDFTLERATGALYWVLETSSGKAMISDTLLACKPKRSTNNVSFYFKTTDDARKVLRMLVKDGHAIEWGTWPKPKWSGMGDGHGNNHWTCRDCGNTHQSHMEPDPCPTCPTIGGPVKLQEQACNACWLFYNNGMGRPCGKCAS